MFHMAKINNYLLVSEQGQNAHKIVSLVLREQVVKEFDENHQKWYQDFCKEYGTDILQAAGDVKSKEDCLNMLGWCSDRGRYVLFKKMPSKQKQEIIEKATFMVECIKMNLFEIFATFLTLTMKTTLEEEKKARVALMDGLENEVREMVSKKNACFKCGQKYFYINKCDHFTCENVYYCNNHCKDDHFVTHK